MDVLFSRKVNLIPEKLSISKDSIWLLINKISALLIIEIEKSHKILYCNPNANRIFSENSLIGNKFSYPIEIGDKNFILVNKVQYTMKTSICSWENQPTYLVLIFK